VSELKKKPERPQWICDGCGQLYGRWHQGNYSGPLHHCATYHMGVCEICKEKTSVTEPRDYGHVVRDWKWRYEMDCKRTQ
jgi:hypothetical protein